MTHLPKPLQAFLIALISAVTSKSSQGTMVGYNNQNNSVKTSKMSHRVRKTWLYRAFHVKAAAPAGKGRSSAAPLSHGPASDPIRSIRTLQDSRLIPPTSLFYSFLHNDLTFLCPSHFVSVDSSYWRDVTHQILLFCFVFYPRWVSTSTRSCRKSGFLTWTLPMILPNRTLGPGRERTGAAWCCCAAVLDLMRGRSPVRCRRADVTAVIEFFYFQDGVGSPLMLGRTAKQVRNIRICVSRGLN